MSNLALILIVLLVLVLGGGWYTHQNGAAIPIYIPGLLGAFLLIVLVLVLLGRI